METVRAIEWLYQKGSAQLDSENYEAARNRFQSILNMTREPGWVEKANAGLARVYLAEDNYFWAIDHIRRALKRNSQEAEYHYIKGQIHLAREEWEQAASEGLIAVEAELENGWYYHLLGKAAYHCEGYRTSRRFLEWAIECTPGAVEIRLELVRVEISEGNYQRALELLKTALKETTEQEKIREALRTIQENWEIMGVQK